MMNHRNRCTDCGSYETVDVDGRDITCCGCGLVLGMFFDERPEHRSFADDQGKYDDHERTGAANEKHLILRIDQKTTLGKRMANFDCQSKTDVKRSRGENMMHALPNVSNCVTGLNIPMHEVELATEMFDDFLKVDQRNGENRKVAFAACLYHATQKKRCVNDISNYMGIFSKHFTHMNNQVSKALATCEKWKSLFLDASDKPGMSDAKIVSMIQCQTFISKDILPRVIAKCKSVVRSCEDTDRMGNRNIEGFINAVMIVVCEAMKVPNINTKEILATSHVHGVQVCKNKLIENLVLARECL